MFYMNNNYLINLEGIFNNVIQLLNITKISLTLEVFHFDISGNEDNALPS